jgi:hypothetical protein
MGYNHRLFAITVTDNRLVSYLIFNNCNRNRLVSYRLFYNRRLSVIQLNNRSVITALI